MNKLNNKKKKLLTIEDLVKFCENKKLTSFSSKETGYQLAVQVPATLIFDENNDLNNSGMTYCKLRVCHTNLNRNGSFISEENMKKALPSLKYRPLLAHIHQLDDGTWDFHSHDMEIDDDGNICYIERQIGAFTADEPYLEYDEDMDKTYVIAYAAVPEDYTMASEIIKNKKSTTVSCELSIENMQYNAKEGYLELQDFYFSGCACLGSEKDGKEIKPGMEGSKLEIADFSQENNSLMNYSEENKDYNNKLIETLEKLNTTLSNFNINKAEFSADETLEEGGNQTVTKLEELMQKYNKTESDINFETEGLSDEELEAKFAEVFEEESSEDPASDEGEDSEGNITDTNACGGGSKKKKKKCEEDSKDDSEEKENDEDDEDDSTQEGTSENDKESEEDDTNDSITDTNACGGGSKKKKKKCDLDSHVIKYSIELNGSIKTYEVSLQDKIYAIQDLVNLTYSESDNTYYGVEVYEEYVIMKDYWSGRAYKQSYSEEDDSYTLTGDRVEVYSVWVTKEEEEALEEMKANYSSISEELSKYQNAEIKVQKEEILSDAAYAEFSETEEFKAIAEEADSLTVEELRTKCELAFAKLVKAQGTFAYTGETKETKKKNKIGINADFEKTDDNEPYGDYFKSLSTY